MLPKNRPPAHPGEMLLKEFLKPAGITQKQFSEHLGWIYARLNEIINGKRGTSQAGQAKLKDKPNTTGSIGMEKSHSLS